MNTTSALRFLVASALALALFAGCAQQDRDPLLASSRELAIASEGLMNFQHILPEIGAWDFKDDTTFKLTIGAEKKETSTTDPATDAVVYGNRSIVRFGAGRGNIDLSGHREANTAKLEEDYPSLVFTAPASYCGGVELSFMYILDVPDKTVPGVCTSSYHITISGYMDNAIAALKNNRSAVLIETVYDGGFAPLMFGGMGSVTRFTINGQEKNPLQAQLLLNGITDLSILQQLIDSHADSMP